MSRRVAVQAVVTAAAVCAAGAARAQDSVSNTPGSSDALSPYAAQQNRYVVDLVPLTGSWGSAYVLGPILKSSAEPGEVANQRLSAGALSVDQVGPLSFPARSFAEWSAPGQGVHPTRNDVPSNVSVTGFDRQFGAAICDFSNGPSNLITCRVGQISTDWQRLHVDRLVALSSREGDAAPDAATLSLGGVDATGAVAFRADAFQATAASKVFKDSIGVIDAAARNSSVNRLVGSTGMNTGLDGAATSLPVNASDITMACPVLLPGSLLGGAPQALSLSLLHELRVGSAVKTGQLDAGIAAHRGNLSLNQVSALGGVAAAATLAKTSSVGGLTQAINAFALDAAGEVVATDAAVMTAPIVTPAGTFNAGGDAEFRHYLGQTIFRGPSGQAGIGFDPIAGATVVAATATDPTMGEFIAVAALTPTPTWAVAAYQGMPVLDGPGGSPIGSLISAGPASISPPAIDLLGNVYFVAAWQPVVGAPAKGFFKAVRTASDYQLELILAEGQAFIGFNSNRSYTVTDLVLVDSDGIASGAFHQGQLLSRRAPGQSTADAANPKAFGGALINATIRYNNAGQPESYDAALFVGPFLNQGVCTGDASGDGTTDLNDLSVVLFNFGLTSGATLAQGDVSGDGAIDLTDLQIVLFDFGCGT